MSLRLILSVALLSAASLFYPHVASAYDCDGGFWGYYALNYHRMPLRTGNVPSPPYFALHPPVYYSGLQHRPYGDSPYAYLPVRPMARDVYLAFPAAVAQGSAAAAGPQIIENQYYEGSTQPENETTSKVIINPYYQADDELAKVD